MGYEQRSEPPEITALADATTRIFLDHEPTHPALVRARALEHVVTHCTIKPEPDTGLLGGEDPFFFNLMYLALRQKLLAAPKWGTDHHGPTAVLQSLSAIDFTGFPDGCALDLRFDPTPFDSPERRDTFAAFLKGFVDLGVMQMQISMVDTETLLDARAHPERYPNLMVKAAGFSARFVDLSEHLWICRNRRKAR